MMDYHRWSRPKSIDYIRYKDVKLHWKSAKEDLNWPCSHHELLTFNPWFTEIETRSYSGTCIKSSMHYTVWSDILDGDQIDRQSINNKWYVWCCKVRQEEHHPRCIKCKKQRDARIIHFTAHKQPQADSKKVADIRYLPMQSLRHSKDKKFFATGWVGRENNEC